MYDVIKRPIITEKTNGLVEKLQYTFEVPVTSTNSPTKNIFPLTSCPTSNASISSPAIS